MSNDRIVLGKGLGALIPNIAGGQKSSWIPATPSVQEGEQILEVSTDVIATNPYQPRRSFDRERLDELAQSIKEYGIIQPLIVTKAADGTYQLVAGERRLKAARLINLAKVPVVVRRMEDQKKLEVSLIENVQRHNLNPLEEALSYKRLMEEFNLTQEELAHRVGKSRSSVANFLRLLTLPKEVLEALAKEQITFSHAKVILSNQGEKSQIKALHAILKEGLTVAQASQPVKKPRSKNATVKDPVLIPWEERLSTRLGFPASIKKTLRGGMIQIEYQSDEDLKSLLDKLLNA